VVAVIVVAALGASWWLTNGNPGLSSGVTSALSRAPVGGSGSPAAPPPSAEAVALADAAHLSDEGRRVFYAAQPEVLGAKAFTGKCSRAPVAQALPAGGAVGCYLSSPDRIFVYEPADPRLRGHAVETAAHETLHAAWERLPAVERDHLVPLLAAAVASLPPAGTLREQLAGSIGSHPENRPTEMFAYIGTQTWHDGGLAPELEAVYARFITDRAALVAVHTDALALLASMTATIQAASQSAADVAMTNARSRAQYDGDAASVAYYRQAYETKAAEVTAMPAANRAGLRLSWVWWDGTNLPMASAKQTLASAAALLARDEAALPTREVAINAAEHAAAAEGARIQGLVSDLNGLQTQLDPSASAS
jgi:hypothetical protein